MTGVDSPYEKAESNSRSLKDSSGLQHNSLILCRDSGYVRGDRL